MIDQTGNRNSDELQIFHDVAKALTSSLDLDTVLQTILEKIAAYFKPEMWSLILLDEETQDLYYALAAGKESEAVNALRLTSGDSLARWVVEHGEALVIEDATSDGRIDPSSCSGFSSQSCSVVCIPIRTSGKILGLMELVNGDMNILRRNEMLLHALADYAAIAIENARAVQRIQELSITDDCTGVYNARHMITVLAEEVRRSERFGYEFSMLFIDLDHFKKINDNYGHLQGSKLLGQFGRSLRKNLRLVDAAFRYGGDEFAVLLPQTGKDAAIQVAHRLTRIFRDTQWMLDDARSVSLSASIGIATYPQDGANSHAIVQRADELMYQAKEAGGNSIAVAGSGVVGRESQSGLAS
ncbi:MAG TPA: sensor domain-containing diguanylate cyclase [Verrucomicrobiae bacterium]|jgi:diguanylate cyclase (GGDEF)-like protein|nr:sensor domain-containing diguanylate cyclase [Verrucomicrobiae bacterium]